MQPKRSQGRPLGKLLPPRALLLVLIGLASVLLNSLLQQPAPAANAAPQPAAGMYTGPLFSTHEHLGIIQGRTVETDAEFFGSIIGQHGVKRVLTFVTTNWLNRPGPGETAIRAAMGRYPDSFAPFISVFRRNPEELPAVPSAVRDMFAEGPFWVGLGEIHAVCPADGEPNSFLVDAPTLLKAYDAVAEFDRTVMVHAGSCHEPLEHALSYDRRVPFLVHGHQVGQAKFPCREIVTQDDFLPCMDASRITKLMRAHPNFFFDLALTANPHMHRATLDGVDVKTHYRSHLDAHVENAFTAYGPAIAAFPDRFLMGWDSGSASFNFDPDFFALGVEFYRKLLGRFDPETARKVAHRNAERLLYRIPMPEAPPDAASLTTLGTRVSWVNPPNTTQYQLQVLPANDDGPAINVIRDADTSYMLPEPVLGQGPYMMLPGMSYRWRVRTSAATEGIDETSPRWRPWSETRTFRTPVPSSAAINPVQPASGTSAPAAGALLQWDNTAREIFYYELQVSADAAFGDNGAVASVWQNQIHGGVSSPVNSWRTPALQPGTSYFWRVRPRVQGDGKPVAWSDTWQFQAQ